MRIKSQDIRAKNQDKKNESKKQRSGGVIACLTLFLFNRFPHDLTIVLTLDS